MVRVSRDGKEIGEYSVPDAIRLLVEGTLRGTDHYWQQGMTDWALLSGLKAKDEVRIKNETRRKPEMKKVRLRKMRSAKRPRLLESRPKLLAFNLKRRTRTISSAIAAGILLLVHMILPKISDRQLGRSS